MKKGHLTNTINPLIKELPKNLQHRQVVSCLHCTAATVLTLYHISISATLMSVKTICS